MSNAEHTAEPSMEDILSSIRKIIAEEPAQSNAEPVAEQIENQVAPVDMSRDGNDVDHGMQPHQAGGAEQSAAKPEGSAGVQGFASNPAVAHGSSEQLITGLPTALPEQQPDQEFAQVADDVGGGIAIGEPAAATPTTPADQSTPVDMNAFDALVAASAPTVIATTPQNDDSCPADPEDLDPLASLIEQAPDHMAASSALSDTAEQFASTLVDPENAAPNLAKVDLSDIAPAPVVPHDAEDASEFVAPKPAELRGALSGRMGQPEPVAAPGLVPGIMTAATAPTIPLALPVTNTQDDSVDGTPGTSSDSPAIPSPDSLEGRDSLDGQAAQSGEAPLSDLLKSLAGAQDRAEELPETATVAQDTLVSAAPEDVTDQEAQAAVEASTNLSHDKLSETLTTLNTLAMEHQAHVAAGTSLGLDDTYSPDPADDGASVDPFMNMTSNLTTDTGSETPADDDDAPGPVDVIGALPPLAETNQPVTEQDNDLHPAVALQDETGLQSKDELTSSDAQLDIDAALLPVTVANNVEETGVATVADLGNADQSMSTELIPGGVRTMEDTVSELLRPMLRNWLDDNMPRILEKTLKLELAAAIEPDADAGENTDNESDPGARD